MIQVQQSTLVVGILAKVQSQLTGNLPRGTYNIPSSDSLLAVAKELGFIESRRGRTGGFEPTDAGLKFFGKNVEEYRAKEASQNIQAAGERAEEARKAREERSHLLQKSLQSVLANAKGMNV